MIDILYPKGIIIQLIDGKDPNKIWPNTKWRMLFHETIILEEKDHTICTWERI